MGESEAVRRLRARIEEYAASDGPVLLTGPAGSGQEAVARAIHHASERSQRAFIYVNCPAQPAGPDPLFAQHGKFELALGGTIYLDGVNRLDEETQRQLAAQIAPPAGEPAPFDVRVIAYAPQSLDEELKRGRVLPALHTALVRGELAVPPLSRTA